MSLNQDSSEYTNQMGRYESNAQLKKRPATSLMQTIIKATSTGKQPQGKRLLSNV